MQKQLMTILEEAKKQLSEAASPEMAEEIRVKVLGKKGKLTEILRSMGSLGAEERKEVGKRANEVRGEIENLLDEKMTELKEKKKQARLAAEVIDVTEPGRIKELGVKHPITQTIDEMSKIFMNMGFIRMFRKSIPNWEPGLLIGIKIMLYSEKLCILQINKREINC